MIIGSYPTSPEESTSPEVPDKIHVKSNGKAVLTGTSLKGAIRARAVKIINTLGGDGAELVKEVFGWADSEGKSKDKRKSRIVVEESVIENADEKIQYRIKIDRFTGGVIDGALFESKPLWHKDEIINVKIKLKNAKEWEVGLLLLVLKDLWSGDLPIGGEKSIGRGVLKGLRAAIRFQGEGFNISENDGKLTVEGKERLEYFVKKFVEKVRR